MQGGAGECVRLLLEAAPSAPGSSGAEQRPGGGVGSRLEPTQREIFVSLFSDGKSVVPEQLEANGCCHLCWKGPRGADRGLGVVGSASGLQSPRSPPAVHCSTGMTRRPEWPSSLRDGLYWPCLDGQAQLRAMERMSPECWVLQGARVPGTAGVGWGQGGPRARALACGLCAPGPGAWHSWARQCPARHTRVLPRPPRGAQASTQPLWNAGAVAVGGSLAPGILL